LARSRVRGQRRSPWPPARRTPSTSRMSGMSSTPVTGIQKHPSVLPGASLEHGIRCLLLIRQKTAI